MKIVPKDIDFNDEILNELPKDFTIISKSARYLVHTFRLIGFSPMVRRLLVCDPCKRSLTIPFPDENNALDIVCQFIQGKDVDIAANHLIMLSQYASYFENIDLVHMVAYQFKKNNFLPKSIENYDYDSSFLSLVAPLNQIKESFVIYMNSQFIFNMPVYILDEILSCLLVQKQIDNKRFFECIYNIVEKNIQVNPAYCSLFCHLNFLELKTEELNQFVSICHPDAISGPLWRAVSQRFRKRVQRPNEENFPYRGNPFFGIFNYFIQNYPDQVGNGTIILDCGGNKQWALPHLFEPLDHSKWWENASPLNGIYRQSDAWVYIGFPSMKLRLTHYTISHSLNSANSAQPKHWIVYGADEKENWVKIHEVTNAQELNVPRGTHTYTINNSTDYYSRFKIQQIENFSKKEHLRSKFVLSAIEFFGNLIHLK